MALKVNASATHSPQSFPLSHGTQCCTLSFRPNQLCRNTMKVFCSRGMAAGHSDGSRKLIITNIADKAKQIWDKAPQPVKDFPWNKALENFVQLILDLLLAVIKYLSVPLFAITSISEMSYCAHERKLYLVPLPFLAGVGVAGVLRNAAFESSPYLKYAEVPWHLIAIALVFALLKIPGPYYPYWGRIFIPHFANGALWRTLWFMFQWYRSPQRKSEFNQPDSTLSNPKADDAQ
ncbi:uncharacterized protein LOC127252558 [Andrographis paniculata]|uniref:uncharacterized protein LOC127252558 n=1 Tax=Andrographis paniculata TaxID=175694 RepID=UPI0021E928FC|nr:uncharacterized protein LOC127252558 [Andrographis paniculata]XP_051132739.1 uncharacterized protein LOC127252558 [Andrographis paniculata]